MINGEGYLSTGIRTVLDGVTRLETDTQGYVIYQILVTVHVSKNRGGWKYDTQWSILLHFKVFWNVVKHYPIGYSMGNAVGKKGRQKIVKKMCLDVHTQPQCCFVNIHPAFSRFDERTEGRNCCNFLLSCRVLFICYMYILVILPTFYSHKVFQYCPFLSWKVF